MSETLIPLNCVPNGWWAEIDGVLASASCIARLGELGLRPGARIRVIQAGASCLLQIGHARFSLRLDGTVQVLVRLIPHASSVLNEVA